MGRPVFSSLTETAGDVAARDGDIETAVYSFGTQAAGTESEGLFDLQQGFSDWQGETMFLTDTSFRFKNGAVPGSGHEVAVSFIIRDENENDIWSTRLNGSQTAMMLDPGVRFRLGTDKLYARVANNSANQVDITFGVSARRDR